MNKYYLGKLVFYTLNLFIISFVLFMCYGLACLFTDNFGNVVYDFSIKTEDGKTYRKVITVDPIFNSFSTTKEFIYSDGKVFKNEADN